MEKYGVTDSDLLHDLRTREASLMQKLANLMSGGEKTASYQALEVELQAVRAEITEKDLFAAKGRISKR